MGQAWPKYSTARVYVNSATKISYAKIQASLTRIFDFLARTVEKKYASHLLLLFSTISFLCIGVNEGCKTFDIFLSTALAFLQKWRILNPFQSILTKVFISSSLIVKSNMSPFSKILSCLLDLGMVM